GPVGWAHGKVGGSSPSERHPVRAGHPRRPRLDRLDSRVPAQHGDALATPCGPARGDRRRGVRSTGSHRGVPGGQVGVADENAEMTRRCYDALWNDRDRDVIAAWIAPEYVGHFTRRPEPIRGVEGFTAMADELFAALPDLRMTIEDLVAGDDRV